MRIIVGIDKSIMDTSYTAYNDKGAVRLDVYEWPVYGTKHIVISATTKEAKQLDFMASEFTLENALDLVETYAKAYL